MSNIKNMQAFEKLAGICTGYGGSYKPGQQTLQADALTALLINAQQTMDTFYSAQTAYDNATNNREVVFKDMRRLCTRIISALESCGAHPLTIDDARSRQRKLWGKLKDRMPVPSGQAAPAENTRRARGSDYASQAEHFAKLVETILAEGNYQLQEAELSKAGLQQKLAMVRAANEKVYAAAITLGLARKKRNEVLYGGEGNVFSTARAAKKYVKAAFGKDSPQYREIVKLRFTKPIR